ncbi:thioesterase II family protein [Amycolatopsis sp. FDAARGOS 1241]|uniref:thioesterase II family protein n=1 Tax=Amycolatopsis sp. FDAARGOS 1241 TaxID=2778070 RepID=UPI00194F9600|nr:alpha/beta fold hydrolase [Amycolatopsis sp. FDAARGOS 1241]QRP48185.1 thioesterase [Amycolatopsis sp. FDAARGOS 1241]
MRDDRWIRRYHPADDARARLVCLPHAGGAASFFHPFSKELCGDADVLAVQYPGRQDRFAEPPFTRIPELADAITQALLPWLDVPVVLFGHSMGATVAFEVGLRLEARGSRPHAVVVSARRAPSVRRAEAVHRLDDDGLLAEVTKLGGIDPLVLADEELRALVVPALRADYTAVETYTATTGMLTAPIHAHAGTNDPRATPDDVRAWAAHTTGGFAFTTHPGGHFYLTERPEPIVAALRSTLAAAP